MSRSRGLIPDIVNRILFSVVVLMVVALLFVTTMLLLSIFLWKSVILSIIFGMCLLLQVVFFFTMMFPLRTSQDKIEVKKWMTKKR